MIPQVPDREAELAEALNKIANPGSFTPDHPMYAVTTIARRALAQYVRRLKEMG